MLRIWIFLLLTLASGADPAIRVALTVDARHIDLKATSWKGHPEWPAQIRLQAKDQGIAVAGQVYPSPLLLDPAHERFSYSGVQHVGRLSVRKAGDRLVLVDRLPLETYLAGVLCGEISADWPRTTLQAHTIASRTYAAYMSTTPRGPDYDVACTTLDQVYAGQSSVSDWLLQLVASTRGQVLCQADGTPIKAYYCSHCGGNSSPSGPVFGSDVPALPPVKDPYCAGYPRSQWTVTVGPDLLRKAATSKGLSWPLTVCKVDGYDESGRIAFWNLEDGKGGVARLSGHEFRMAVGPRQLPSTRCKLLSGGESLTLAGSGWGHGVGLCQWGSYEMGQRGMTARQILSHYYPTCSLRDWAKRNQS